MAVNVPPIYRKKFRKKLRPKIQKMQVGDVLFFSNTASGRARNAAQFCKNKYGMKFVTRQTRTGIKLWRVE
jgi:hypothetical protein